MVIWKLSSNYSDEMTKNTVAIRGTNTRMATAQGDLDEGIEGTHTSARGLRRLIGPFRQVADLLKQVGLLSNDSYKALMVCFSAVTLSIGFYQVYLAIKSMYDTLTATQWAMAASETAAHAAAQDYGSIALAAAVAAAVPIGLTVGYEIAHQQSIKARADYQTPAGRRSVTATLQTNDPRMVA